MAGDRVRDHLANERTFLAWIRTGIALIGLGVVIAKLRFLEAAVPAAAGTRTGWGSTALGLAFAGVGVLTLLLAAGHYARVCRAIQQDTFQPSGRALLWFTAIVFALGLASIGYLLTLRPG